MTKLQEYKEKAIAYRVRTKWENVLLDSICPYDDGSIGLTFAVCVNYKTVKLVTVVIERYDFDLDSAIKIIDERIAWAFAFEHLRNV